MRLFGCLPATLIMTGARKILLSERQIKKVLAHREPFLLVHHAIENVIGEKVTTVARQNDDLTIPSRLQILEGLGQTSALLIKQMPMYERQSLPVFASMRNVFWNDIGKSQGMVLYTAELQRASRSRFGIVDAYACVGDSKICTGELVFSFLEGM